MGGHNNLIRSQGDEGASGHGVMRDIDRDLGRVLLNGQGDLQRGQNQSARGVQDDIQRYLVVG